MLTLLMHLSELTSEFDEGAVPFMSLPKRHQRCEVEVDDIHKKNTYILEDCTEKWQK